MQEGWGEREGGGGGGGGGAGCTSGLTMSRKPPVAVTMAMGTAP